MPLLEGVGFIESLGVVGLLGFIELLEFRVKGSSFFQ